MTEYSQSNLIPGQKGRKMLGAVNWGPDAMTLLPTGSVVLCEDDVTQHKKKS